MAAVVWLAAAATQTEVWAQTSDTPAPPPSSQLATPTVPNLPVRKRSELGVWHHFGEGHDKPAPAPSQSGAWHHFGEERNSPPQPLGFPSGRTAGPSRTQQMERFMFEWVNRDRAEPANMAETHGRAFPLRWNDQLAAVARAHSLDMLKRGYFAHEDPQGKSVDGRVEAAGMAWQAVGENIAIAASVANAQGAFMNEPRFTKNHRANVLSTNFTDVGIGIVQGPDGRLYITQDFYTAPAHP
jgi:uncharacterized protein YkwD